MSRIAQPCGRAIRSSLFSRIAVSADLQLQTGRTDVLYQWQLIFSPTTSTVHQFHLKVFKVLLREMYLRLDSLDENNILSVGSELCLDRN